MMIIIILKICRFISSPNGENESLFLLSALRALIKEKRLTKEGFPRNITNAGSTRGPLNGDFPWLGLLLWVVEILIINSNSKLIHSNQVVEMIKTNEATPVVLPFDNK